MGTIVWSLLLLSGFTSCTEVQEKVLPKWLDKPERVPDWWPVDIDKPDWFPNIPLTPANPEWVPWPQNPDNRKLQLSIEKIERWPLDKSIYWPQRPEWWPEVVPWPIHKPAINKPVRGTPATIEEFPGLVQIEVGSGPIWAQGCAGSVLTSLHILTAASCVSGKYYNDRFRRIRAGSSTRFSDGTIIDFERVTVHPSFNIKENFLDGDIAVVRLRSYLTLGPTIQQAAIVSPGFKLNGGQSVVLSGWGSTAQGKKITDHNLHKIDLVSVDNNACADVWNTLIPISKVKVTSNMICIGQDATGGRDADFRDNGAPIIYDNIVVGVVSWGIKLGNQRFPVVATAVSSYTNWILNTAV